MTASDILNLTAEEKASIANLRKKCSDLLDEKQKNDTYMFYRFLKARDFDAVQAEEMLRKSLQWRRQNKVDAVLTDYTPPEALKVAFGKNLMCVDREGSAVRYIPVGKMDFKGICMSAKFSDFERITLFFVESDIKSNKENSNSKVNGYFPGLSFVYDMEELTFAKASYKRSLEYLVRILRMFQDHYPECLKTVYIINASTYFTFMFNFTKPFLAQSILSKINVFSKEGWTEELLKAIDINHLPAFLGGEKTDPDGNPLCQTFLYHGGHFPTKYYIVKKGVTSLCGRPDVEKLVLPRAAFSEIAIRVDEPGAAIEWEFETKNRDIGFGLFRKEGEGEEEVIEELVPLSRLDTENFAETGIYKCEKTGTYVMLFDNSYSWIRSKEIYYRTKIVSPSEQKSRIEKQ